MPHRPHVERRPARRVAQLAFAVVPAAECRRALTRVACARRHEGARSCAARRGCNPRSANGEPRANRCGGQVVIVFAATARGRHMSRHASQFAEWTSSSMPPADTCSASCPSHRLSRPRCRKSHVPCREVREEETVVKAYKNGSVAGRRVGKGRKVRRSAQSVRENAKAQEFCTNRFRYMW